MTWITYKASDIGFNGQFGGSEGNFTYQPQWSLSEGQFKIDVVGDRVLADEIRNVLRAHGVNPELNRTEAKRKDIAAMRAEGLL